MAFATIDDAVRLAVDKFYGVTDEEGEPYLLHCLRVMHGVDSPQVQLPALLHDIVEDTDVTLADLTELGFAPEVVHTIDLMTHREGVSYADYVVRLSENSWARQVKLSDLRDNADLRRVLYREEQQQRDAARIGRYVLSYQFLSGRLDEDEYRRRMSDIDELRSQD
jgi:(p)ppGpp synthase/HD superfamily hydrolase